MKFFKYFLAFTAGAGLSFVVTRRVLKTKYEQEMQNEIDDVTNYYRERIKKVEEDAANEIREMVTQLEGEDTEKVEEVVSGEDDDESETKYLEEYDKKTTDYSAMFREVAKPSSSKKYVDPAEEEFPGEDDAEEIEAEVDNKRKSEVAYDEPYIITSQEYTNENTHYDKVNLTYYAEDDVLVDENEEHISDVDYLVGDEALLNFGTGSEDPDIVYVRNERISTDYEIIRVFRSYSRDILGIDDSHIRPSKNTRSKRGVLNEE